MRLTVTQWAKWLAGIRWLALLAALCAGRAAGVHADQQKGDAPKPPEDAPPTVALVLTPAAEPRPALRYPLFPPLLDRQPGNAAVFYNKAVLIYKQNADLAQQSEKMSQWTEAPRADLPLSEIEKALQRWHNVFEEIRFGAKREQCDWQLPYREQVPFSILLPEIQELRAVVRALVVQARLEVAQRQFDEAVNTLQTLYALARHVALGDTYIHALVGIATLNQLSRVHEDLVQQTGAPNLYWSLAWLPRPFVDLRHGSEFEMSTVYLWRPEFLHLDRQTRTPDGWRQLYEEFIDALADFDSGVDKQQRRLVMLGRAIKGYPRAKQELIDGGRLPEQVEAMSVAQVLLLHMVQTYNELRDDHFKWTNLPYAEARAGMDKADRHLRERGRHREIIPLAQLLLPAVQHAANAQARGERTIAVLRTIEALRIYAAAHAGRLPEQLDEITEVPVPSDPFTGGPFLYECSENKAVLEAPLFEGMPSQMGKRYEITVAK